MHDDTEEEGPRERRRQSVSPQFCSIYSNIITDWQALQPFQTVNFSLAKEKRILLICNIEKRV